MQRINRADLRKLFSWDRLPCFDASNVGANRASESGTSVGCPKEYGKRLGGLAFGRDNFGDNFQAQRHVYLGEGAPTNLAMGQNPIIPVNIPIPAKMD